ncbi:MAG: polysaccharide deacetylase family protein [Planctomycetota bacterium]
MARITHPWRKLGLAALALLLIGNLGAGCWPPFADNRPTDWTKLPTDGSVLLINLQVDAELAHPDDEETDLDATVRVLDELTRRRIPATVYVTGAFANRASARVQQLHEGGYEIALHGYNTGEQLATMSHDEQLDVLTRAWNAVRGCVPCGTARPVIGFRAQYFSQNADTSAILGTLGFVYNGTYKAGQITLAGYESQREPFLPAGATVWVVPVTTIPAEGTPMYMCDISSHLARGLSGAQWQEASHTAIEQARAQGEPLVVILHGWHLGNDDNGYWQPFLRFLDEAAAAGEFVTTGQLVELYGRAAPE